MPDYEALGYALGAMAGVLVVVALIVLALAIFMVVCNVFIYKKMGAHGWGRYRPVLQYVGAVRYGVEHYALVLGQHRKLHCLSGCQ